jgi:hypothetical protein
VVPQETPAARELAALAAQAAQYLAIYLGGIKEILGFLPEIRLVRLLDFPLLVMALVPNVTVAAGEVLAVLALALRVTAAMYLPLEVLAVVVQALSTRGGLPPEVLWVVVRAALVALYLHPVPVRLCRKAVPLVPPVHVHGQVAEAGVEVPIK